MDDTLDLRLIEIKTSQDIQSIVNALSSGKKLNVTDSNLLAIFNALTSKDIPENDKALFKTALEKLDNFDDFIRAKISVEENTLFHRAVLVGDEPLARWLFNSNADFTATNAYGLTPLEVATIKNNQQMLDILEYLEENEWQPETIDINSLPNDDPLKTIMKTLQLNTIKNWNETKKAESSSSQAALVEHFSEVYQSNLQKTESPKTENEKKEDNLEDVTKNIGTMKL